MAADRRADSRAAAGALRPSLEPRHAARAVRVLGHLVARRAAVDGAGRAGVVRPAVPRGRADRARQPPRPRPFDAAALMWKGWPVVAFICTTVYGQMTSVYQYPLPVLIILGGSTVLAAGVGLLYGRDKRVWCRFLCPVSGVFTLLAKLAPLHFRTEPQAWRSYRRPGRPAEGERQLRADGADRRHAGRQHLPHVRPLQRLPRLHRAGPPLAQSRDRPRRRPRDQAVGDGDAGGRPDGRRRRRLPLDHVGHLHRHQAGDRRMGDRPRRDVAGRAVGPVVDPHQLSRPARRDGAGRRPHARRLRARHGGGDRDRR